MAVYTCDFGTLLHFIVFVSSTVIIAIDSREHVFHRKSRASSVRASCFFSESLLNKPTSVKFAPTFMVQRNNKSPLESIIVERTACETHTW